MVHKRIVRTLALILLLVVGGGALSGCNPSQGKTVLKYGTGIGLGIEGCKAAGPC